LVLLTKTWLLERSEAMRDLIASFRAGTLRPPKPARPRTTPEVPPPPRQPPAPGPERVPTRFGWLRGMIGEVGDAGRDLAEMAGETEMRELAAATPRAGVLLRPLLRMLGEEVPEWLKLPPRPPKPEEPELEPFRPLAKRYNSIKRWKHHTVAPPEPPPAPPVSPPPYPPDPPPSAPAPRTWPRWVSIDMSR
jgi:hypothetical protein